MIILFLVIVHVLICITLHLMIRSGLLKCSSMVMMLVWFVPVWGILCLLILDIRSRGRQETREQVAIEKLMINDEAHRSILMDEDAVERLVVPLEEALIVDDASVRRELMMDVMYSNPEDYVQQLQAARMNDDTEVVHYAVTALVELQKEYELRFQVIERKYSENPEDEELLDEYILLVERYMASGLLEGNGRTVQLHTYSRLLGKKLQRSVASPVLYKKKIEADLQLKAYDAAYAAIQKFLELWPKNEIGYLELLKYYSAAGDRKGIEYVLSIEEKLMGIEERQKWRIRIYNYSDARIKLERKKKRGSYIHKDSATLTRSEFDQIMQGDYAFLLHHRNLLCQEFYYECTVKLQRPKVIVDYEREPLIRQEGDVRITFDSDVRAALAGYDIFDPKLPTLAALEPDTLVLEVKFTEFLPGIIRELLPLDGLQFLAVSKYTLCYERAHHLTDPLAGISKTNRRGMR